MIWDEGGGNFENVLPFHRVVEVKDAVDRRT
jgi:hypothetical protein